MLTKHRKEWRDKVFARRRVLASERVCLHGAGGGYTEKDGVSREERVSKEKEDVIQSGGRVRKPTVSVN